jgi:hypothetical protein
VRSTEQVVLHGVLPFFTYWPNNVVVGVFSKLLLLVCVLPDKFENQILFGFFVCRRVCLFISAPLLLGVGVEMCQKVCWIVVYSHLSSIEAIPLL